MTIKVKLIEDSIGSFNQVRLTTMQLYYPRYIHSEVLTHRMWSRNASSSRAIPVKKMIEMIQEDPVIPVHWGKNKKGMQAKEELEPDRIQECKNLWLGARDQAISYVKGMISAGLHKQIANRILEPWMHINVVVTATDWKNFFMLRCHPDAHPDIQALAYEMREVYQGHRPRETRQDDWHLPYVTEEEKDYFAIESLKKISVARCARVSYVTFENKPPDPEKDMALHDMLLDSKHMSPFENVATPLYDQSYCANLRGWKMYRKFLPNESPNETL